LSGTILDDFVSSISKLALWLNAGDSIAQLAFAAIFLTPFVARFRSLVSSG
jgi:hypothetical protein